MRLERKKEGRHVARPLFAARGKQCASLLREERFSGCFTSSRRLGGGDPIECSVKSPASDKVPHGPTNYLKLLEDPCCRRTTAEPGPCQTRPQGWVRGRGQGRLQGTRNQQFEGEEQPQSEAAINQHIAALAEHRNAVEQARTPGCACKEGQQRQDSHGGVLVPDPAE